MALTVLNCHKILIENVCRLFCKSMHPTMFIRLCVKLKHVNLVSYAGVEKLAAKLNVVLLWQSYIMSKISLKLCKFSPWNLLNLDLGKMCEPCNSFLAKIRESQKRESGKSQKVRESKLNKLGENPDLCWFISGSWVIVQNES